jgi:hypothetical protein
MRTLSKLFTTAALIVGAVGFAKSCHDNYIAGALPFFSLLIIFVSYRITAIDNEILRREKDRGREILTELYNKYER